MTKTNLIEALEKADGPSRELDSEIALIVNFYPDGIEDIGCYVDPAEGCVGGQIYSAPNYTSSLDAALTLVPKGHLINTLLFNQSKKGAFSLRSDSRCILIKRGNIRVIGDHNSPAIAICIAVLRARENDDER